MIPKIIHYCWLSEEPFPADIQECMLTWKKLLPDYEFIHWNFKNFPKGKSKWVDDAFDNRKYAFAADYIRLYALYNYGGIYLDTDVLLKKSYDPFLILNTMLGWQFGYKHNTGLEVAAFGVEKGCEWVKQCLDSYDGQEFVNESGKFDLTPLPMRINRILVKLGYQLLTVNTIEEALEVQIKQGLIPVFTYDFFSPKSYISGKIYSTNQTVSIHNFAGGWLEKKDASFWMRIKHFFWYKTGLADLEIKKRLRYRE